MTHPAEPPLILLVDDNAANRGILQFALADRYGVVEAASAEEALEIAKASRPDLVLLDINMPGIGGYGFLERWRQEPSRKDIPVICVTAQSALESELRGLQLGAVDYITKPFAIPAVLARVETHLELRSARLRIEAQNTRLLEERRLVEEIINRLRGERDFDAQHLRFALSSVDHTNGDVLLSATTLNGRQWVLAGDVAGHGLPAAVCVPLLSHVFYEQARQGGDFVQMLALLNSVMYARLPGDIFISCCAMEIDRQAGRALLRNGGLPDCLRRGTLGAIERFASSGLPLGIVPELDIAAEIRTLPVKSGEFFYVFSDGLTELTAPNGGEFGVQGVVDYLRGAGNVAGFETLWPMLRNFHGSADYPDDITLLEIRV